MIDTAILSPARPSRERGEAYLAAALTLVLIGIAVAGLVTWQQNQVRESQARRTAEGIVAIQEALYSYRLDPANSLSWPSLIADLDPYIPNFTDGGRNGVGQPYSLAAVTPATPTSGILIETDMLTAEGANDVARLFPLNGSVPADTTRVRVGVPAPGHEESRDTVLAVDGNKEMTGTLDMDGNSIVNLAEIEIDGETIDVDTVEMLTEMASLNCTGDERVMLVSGTPTCVAASQKDVCSPNPPKQSNSKLRWNCSKETDSFGCRWKCRSSCAKGYSSTGTIPCYPDPNAPNWPSRPCATGTRDHLVCSSTSQSTHSSDAGTCVPTGACRLCYTYKTAINPHNCHPTKTAP